MPAISVPDRRRDVGVTKEILNDEEAAAFLGVSVKTLRRYVDEEDVPYRKIGGSRRYSRAALVDWVGCKTT